MLRSVQSELLRAPAMVMAFGIFQLFAAEFLLRRFAPQRVADAVLLWAGLLIALWSAILLVLFLRQVSRDRKPLWDFTADHFAIGTWVAGLNVLARVLLPISPATARVANLAGWAVWLMYMAWLSEMVRHTNERGKLNGAAFLTTVATQSVVVSSARLWPELPDTGLYVLLGVSVFGLALYGVHFYLIWFAIGVRNQVRNWAPPNNVTHGALSISVLALELLAGRMPAIAGHLLPVIEAVWLIATVLFAAIAAVEVRLLVTDKGRLLKFRMANYSRNFTYGMYFACTYFGLTQFPGSLMSRGMSAPVLVVLAALVVLVNAWELGHQVTNAFRAPAREAGRFCEEVQHG